jgi:hypothetical protein
MEVVTMKADETLAHPPFIEALAQINYDATSPMFTMWKTNLLLRKSDPKKLQNYFLKC